MAIAENQESAPIAREGFHHFLFAGSRGLKLFRNEVLEGSILASDSVILLKDLSTFEIFNRLHLRLKPNPAPTKMKRFGKMETYGNFFFPSQV